MGWQRFFKYIKLRVIRIGDTPQKVAAGLALGGAISFSPIIGTHIIQAMLLAFMFRVNVFASIIGTIIGNPWTFPLMWLAAINLGAFLFGLFGVPTEASVPEIEHFTQIWDFISDEPMRFFVPWLVGGYGLAILSWPIFYYLFYTLITSARKRRRGAKKNRINDAKGTAKEREEEAKQKK